MTNLEKAFLFASVALIGVTVLKVGEASASRATTGIMRKRLSALEKQYSLLQGERDDLARQLAALHQASRTNRTGAEVLRLRSEVARTKSELAAEKTGATQKLPHGYLSREQISFAGFDTAANSLQSSQWALISGDFATYAEGVVPEDATATNDFKISFERGMALEKSPAALKAMTILAEKQLNADRVELKVAFTTESSTVTLICPMVRVGNTWRQIAARYPYGKSWDE